MIAAYVELFNICTNEAPNVEQHARIEREQRRADESCRARQTVCTVDARHACSAVWAVRTGVPCECVHRVVVGDLGDSADCCQMCCHGRERRNRRGSGRRHVRHARDFDQSRLHVDGNDKRRVDRGDPDFRPGQRIAHVSRERQRRSRAAAWCAGGQQYPAHRDTGRCAVPLQRHAREHSSIRARWRGECGDRHAHRLRLDGREPGPMDRLTRERQR